MKTHQEIFDAALNGIRSQNYVRSVKRFQDGSESCRYRGDNGCRCAIGWNIPDAAYNREVEGFSVNKNTVRQALCSDSMFKIAGVRMLRESELPLDNDSLDFMHQVQHAHDETLFRFGLAHYELRMKEIAGCDGLVYTAPARSAP